MLVIHVVLARCTGAEAGLFKWVGLSERESFSLAVLEQALPPSLDGPERTPIFLEELHPLISPATYLAQGLPSLGAGKTDSERLRIEPEDRMSTLVIILLVLLLVGALPSWPYSSGWGYYPSGGLGLVLLIVLILALTGRL